MSKFRFDNNFDAISKAFHTVARDRQQGMYGVAKQIIFSTFQFIIVKSPVDTGRYRAAHSLEEGDPPATASSNLTMLEGLKGINSSNAKRAEALKLLDEELKTSGKNQKKTLYIMNPLPYAHALERGHSGQAPSGVYTVARQRAAKLWKKAVG